MGAARKDIEEWASLTMQLIENAFNNAEHTYLSNLWPTPPASPRIETVYFFHWRENFLKLFYFLM